MAGDLASRFRSKRSSLLNAASNYKQGAPTELSTYIAPSSWGKAEMEGAARAVAEPGGCGSRDSSMFCGEKSVLPRNSSLFAGMETMFARDFTVISRDSRVLRRDMRVFSRNSTMLCGTKAMFSGDSRMFSRDWSMLRRGDAEVL
jgi:hypothetical protein